MTNSKPTIQRIEMKFQLDASLSREVKDWARDHLGVDDNCNSGGDDSYDIYSLYLDTPELDLYHRTGRIGRAKHRIRRYGKEQTLWVETKRKKNMVVRKNRTAVFESDLMARLAACPLDRAAFDDPWCGDWFIDRVAARRLQPAIQIGYRRFARTSTLDGENLRLTIDSNMHAGPIDGWNIASDSSNAFGSIGDSEILELKFHNQMPHLFRELLRTFPIPATGFSKYRTAIGSLATLEHAA